MPDAAGASQTSQHPACASFNRPSKCSSTAWSGLLSPGELDGGRGVGVSHLGCQRRQCGLRRGHLSGVADTRCVALSQLLDSGS
jgi:hypothetical protein